MFVASLLTGTVMADEGMWLFNRPPTKLLKERHGFDATETWLAHLQKSAVRFNSGGSGSFVSADGLVMTNHHVGPTPCKAQHQRTRPDRARLLCRHARGRAQVRRSGTERADEHRGRDRRVNTAVRADMDASPRSRPAAR